MPQCGLYHLVMFIKRLKFSLISNHLWLELTGSPICLHMTSSKFNLTVIWTESLRGAFNKTISFKFICLSDSA